MPYSSHSKHAADLGEPSYVWRAGQDRRWQMIAEWSRLHTARRILDFGTGIGLYLQKFAEREHLDVVAGTEYEFERAMRAAQRDAGGVVQSAEPLPFSNDIFDVVLSHEVLEHVSDDRLAAAEMIRVLRPGGRAIVFVPNRWWLFETHGIYWRGDYHFGNYPLVNYLPDAVRNRLTPHVRAYTSAGVRRLFAALPVRIVHHTQVFPGYDNLVARRPVLGKIARTVTYTLEQTPARIIGLSHVLVLEKDVFVE